MTTYSITINERTAFGKELIRNLSAMPEIIFEKAVQVRTDSENKIMIERMREAAKNAKKIAASHPKTYSAKELMEVL